MGCSYFLYFNPFASRLVPAKIIFYAFYLVLCLFFVFFLTGCTEEKNSNNSLQEARESFARKEYLDAEKLYERFLRYVPESEERWEAWERVAYIALNIRRDERLTADILEAMALEYTDRPVQYQDVLKRLADLYEANHRWDRAKSAWERMLASQDLPDASRGEALLHLAHIYQLRFDYVNAKKYLEICLKMQTNDEIRAKALYSLAISYSDQGESKAAEEKLLELTTMKGAPNEIKVQGLFMLGDLMDDQGKLKEALELFTSIETTYPNPQAVEVRVKSLQDRINK